MRSLALKLVLLTGLTLISCQRSTTPLEPESDRRADLRSPKYGTHYIEKTIEDQICRIYYTEKIPSTTGWETAPDSIRIKAENYVKNQIGESIFNSRFQFRSSEIVPVEARSQIQEECYVVSWHFAIQIEDYSTYRTVACYLDSTGHVVREEGISGLESLKDSNGKFVVTDKLAVKTAQVYGLEQGLDYWTVSFYHYSGNLEKYVWSVSNILDDYSGRTLIIDSNDPVVIQSSNWILVDAEGW